MHCRRSRPRCGGWVRQLPLEARDLADDVSTGDTRQVHLGMWRGGPGYSRRMRNSRDEPAEDSAERVDVPQEEDVAEADAVGHKAEDPGEQHQRREAPGAPGQQ